MVNYFFPIRLNVLIVMGLDLLKCNLGPAGGLALLGDPESNFWEGPKPEQSRNPTFGEGPENLRAQHSVKGSSPVLYF